MEINSQNDPNGWLHVLAGGFLAAAGRWVWGRLMRSPRPAGGQHSNAYIAEQVRLIAERLDTQGAQLEDISKRLSHVEFRRATGAD